MRYIPPNYPAGPEQFGNNLDHLILPDVNTLVRELTTHLINETNGGKDWPNFSKFGGSRWTEVFNNFSKKIKIVFIVTDTIPDLLPEQVVLDHIEYENSKVKIFDTAKSRLITVSKFFIN